MDQLEPLTDPPRLQAAKHQSPEWFAAASSPDASLLEMAPELLALPPDHVTGSSTPQVAPDLDIIGIYAPETTGDYARPARVSESVVSPADVDEPAAITPDHEDGQHPRTAVQMGLLKELADLDQ